MTLCLIYPFINWWTFELCPLFIMFIMVNGIHHLKYSQSCVKVHFFTKACYFLFDYSHLSGCEVVLFAVLITFPCRLRMLSLFSCAIDHLYIFSGEPFNQILCSLLNWVVFLFSVFKIKLHWPKAFMGMDPLGQHQSQIQARLDCEKDDGWGHCSLAWRWENRL